MGYDLKVVMSKDETDFPLADTYVSYNQHVNKEYWSVNECWRDHTVEQALEKLNLAIARLRKEGFLRDHVYSCYSTDKTTFLSILCDLRDMLEEIIPTALCISD